MVNNGTLWLDNVYVKVDRQKMLPEFAFITMGASQTDCWSRCGVVTSSDAYITNVTFHSEAHRNAFAIKTAIHSASVLVSGAVCVTHTIPATMVQSLLKAGWSSRGSRVCVTMLALQCQC